MAHLGRRVRRPSLGAGSELSDEERRRINYRMEEINGMQSAFWNVIPLLQKDYEFTGDERERLLQIVNEWRGYRPIDRVWAEPLLSQLEGEAPPRSRRILARPDTLL